MTDGETTVHPRAGGEHVNARIGASTTVGSSPRGRGTQLPGRLPGAGGRFIPARAGNTATSPSRRRRRAVHPRAGGEHEFPGSGIPRLNGSSPRGRGTRQRSLRFRAGHRFIPARAGNTPGALPSRGRGAVHPRAGGEHGNLFRSDAAADGSSPRGRGTHRLDGEDARRERFIPARAGNTPPICAGARARSVHPRAGGEHPEAVWLAAARLGSSPRGRGTPDAWRRVADGIRFIPARAGNT